MRGESFVSKNSVCVFIRRSGRRVSSALIQQLDVKVKEMLEEAIRRAGKNGRSTVMPQDL